MKLSLLQSVRSRISNIAQQYLLTGLLSTALILMQAGCEARLNLEKVEQTKQQAILRTDQLLDITRSKDNSLIMVGSNGLILRSTNNTATWQRTVLKQHPNFIGITRCPDGTLAALAYERSVWSSIDDGKNWSAKPLPTSEDVMAIHCAPNGSLWVTGSFSTLLHSTDNGETWLEQTLNEDAMLTAIQFLDENYGVAAGEFGIFMVTLDAGLNWQQMPPIGDEFFPLAIFFSDRAHGWAASLSGLIMHTSDAGHSWQRQETESNSPIYNFVYSSGELLALGDHGTVLRLNNSRWERVDAPDIPVYLRSGIALDNDMLLVVGGWGTQFTLNQNTEEKNIVRN